MVVEELGVKNKINSSVKATPSLRLYNHNSSNTVNPEISVIMPAFNEEKAVGSLIDRTKKVLEKITNNYEIIVIDDGSKDQTFDICRQKHVLLIHNKNNCGKGYALRAGFKYARGDIVITIDSDGDHHPEDIPSLIRPLKNGTADIVLGTRFTEKNHHPVTTPTNIFGNKLFNFLIRCLTNKKFTDTQCGFRSFNRSILSQLTLESDGYDIETEMILKLTRKKIRFCEIPVSSGITYFRKSNIKRVQDGFKILYSIFISRFKKI